MLGIEDYGSDVESDSESQPQTSTSSKSTPLPPPKAHTPSVPAPGARVSSSTTKPKQPKKILLNLPSLPLHSEEDAPPAKKPRITTSSSQGAQKSSLLGMLPAPKQPLPVKEKKSERVLGGGGGPGLVFRAAKSEYRGDVEVEDQEDTTNDGPSKVSVAPPARKAALPSVDFFSLGSFSAPVKHVPSTLSTASGAPSTSAAPSIPTFRPPSPTLDDPYPGYYQLPSGAYAPYDTDHYASYARKWKADYDKQIRALENLQHNASGEDMQDVDMAAEMEKARREIQVREERKALTTGKVGKSADGEPEMPKMNVKGAKLGGVARARHQLTTLLTDAYLNRDALEEKIAQARRNRKEAGNKYGF